MHNIMTFIPVILCGGSGSRLFPLSRNTFPKQFVKINGDHSLLQNTLIRFLSCEEIVLVSGKKHMCIINAQIKELVELKLLNPKTKITIFLEPVGKNTLPAVTIVCEYFKYSKLLFIPCDHIYNTTSLLESVNKGIERNQDVIVFGIKPTYPETGFGYIESDMDDFFVNKFIEKPNFEKAKLLIENSNIYWNSGIFLLEPNNFLSIVKRLKPTILEIIIGLNNTNTQEDTIIYIGIDERYSECENISIDYGIIEHLEPKTIYMIKYDDLWNDIGSFKSIHEISIKDDSLINTDSNILNLDSSNCLIKSDKLVLLNNVSGLSIIDTHDTLMISNTNKSQEVKKLYEMAICLGKKEISYNHFDYRPWGYYEVLAGGDNMGFKIKKIIVYPNKRLSLQSHNFRKEYWFCINGIGKAIVDNNLICIDSLTNTMVYVDIKQKHRLVNESKSNLEIIEIQLGTYLGEDDIIRYEDDYNRVSN